MLILISLWEGAHRSLFPQGRTIVVVVVAWITAFKKITDISPKPIYIPDNTLLGNFSRIVLKLFACKLSCGPFTNHVLRRKILYFTKFSSELKSLVFS